MPLTNFIIQTPASILDSPYVIGAGAPPFLVTVQTVRKGIRYPTEYRPCETLAKATTVMEELAMQELALWKASYPSEEYSFDYGDNGVDIWRVCKYSTHHTEIRIVCRVNQLGY